MKILLPGQWPKNAEAGEGFLYDYGHALAAVSAGADVILTRNQSDFAGIAGQARIEWP